MSRFVLSRVECVLPFRRLSLIQPLPLPFFCRIGKWRCKELFVQGRKTCSLAHTRIGAAPLELGVWEIGELDSLGVTEEVVRHCERMWVDRTLARMAVPDVLEVESIDRDGDVSSSLLFHHATPILD